MSQQTFTVTESQQQALLAPAAAHPASITTPSAPQPTDSPELQRAAHLREVFSGISNRSPSERARIQFLTRLLDNGLASQQRAEVGAIPTTTAELRQRIRSFFITGFMSSEVKPFVGSLRENTPIWWRALLIESDTQGFRDWLNNTFGKEGVALLTLHAKLAEEISYLADTDPAKKLKSLKAEFLRAILQKSVESDHQNAKMDAVQLRQLIREVALDEKFKNQMTEILGGMFSRTDAFVKAILTDHHVAPSYAVLKAGKKIDASPQLTRALALQKRYDAGVAKRQFFDMLLDATAPQDDGELRARTRDVFAKGLANVFDASQSAAHSESVLDPQWWQSVLAGSLSQRTLGWLSQTLGDHEARALPLLVSELAEAKSLLKGSPAQERKLLKARFLLAVLSALPAHRDPRVVTDNAAFVAAIKATAESPAFKNQMPEVLAGRQSRLAERMAALGDDLVATYKTPVNPMLHQAMALWKAYGNIAVKNRNSAETAKFAFLDKIFNTENQAAPQTDVEFRKAVRATFAAGLVLDAPDGTLRGMSQDGWTRLSAGVVSHRFRTLLTSLLGPQEAQLFIALAQARVAEKAYPTDPRKHQTAFLAAIANELKVEDGKPCTEAKLGEAIQAAANREPHKDLVAELLVKAPTKDYLTKLERPALDALLANGRRSTVPVAA